MKTGLTFMFMAITVLQGCDNSSIQQNARTETLDQMTKEKAAAKNAIESYSQMIKKKETNK